MSSRILPFCGGGSLNHEFERMSRSFNESFLIRLQTLINTPPSISTSWLLLAVEFLTETHVSAQALVSSLKCPDYDFGSSSDQIELYRHHMSKLTFYIDEVGSDLGHIRNRINKIDSFCIFPILSEGGQVLLPEKLQEAKFNLAKWEDKMGKLYTKNVKIGTLLGYHLMKQISSSPCGYMCSPKRSLIRQTFYAVRLATVFVAGFLASSVYRKAVIDFGRVQASETEFMWAYSFNNLKSAVCDEMNNRRWCLAEIDDVQKRVIAVRELLDEALSGGSNDVVKLTSALNELKTVKDEVVKGLNNLGISILGLRGVIRDLSQMLKKVDEKNW